MVSVEEALKILELHAGNCNPVNKSVKDALHHVLAEDVYAPSDSPPFNQSAMDGYALHAEHLKFHHPIPVRAEIPAGSTQLVTLEEHTAARIFTGAPVPNGANTVVVIEQTSESNGMVTIQPHTVSPGMNIRPMGSHLGKGMLAASQGTFLTPGILGFLASIGIAEVTVYSKPRVGVMVTGNELVPPGNSLGFGQVYENNSVTLQTALAEFGIETVFCDFVKDELSVLREQIKHRLPECDFLLITGGVSAGKYDFVVSALEQEGVTHLFHKVNQRPGKPLYAGKSGSKLVLGLPGNPASVTSCFYIYAAPVIRKLSGMPFYPEFQSLPLAIEFKKKPGLTFIMRSSIQESKVVLSNDQESYKMNAFVQANHFCILESDREFYQAGEKVHTINLNLIWK